MSSSLPAPSVELPDDFPGCDEPITRNQAVLAFAAAVATAFKGKQKTGRIREAVLRFAPDVAQEELDATLSSLHSDARAMADESEHSGSESEASSEEEEEEPDYRGGVTAADAAGPSGTAAANGSLRSTGGGEARADDEAVPNLAALEQLVCRVFILLVAVVMTHNNLPKEAGDPVQPGEQPSDPSSVCRADAEREWHALPREQQLAFVSTMRSVGVALWKKQRQLGRSTTDDEVLELLATMTAQAVEDGAGPSGRAKHPPEVKSVLAMLTGLQPETLGALLQRQRSGAAKQGAAPRGG